MQACAFCRIVRGEDVEAVIVWEDQHTVAFAPLKPATQGHTLVVPKEHATQLWDLSKNDAAAVMSTTLTVSQSLRQTLQPDGLNIIQSNGAAATQTVAHVHVHVVPRWKRDRMTLRWPRMGAQTRSQQRITADRVHKEMQSATAAGVPAGTPEDRRQHLSFIQSVISRMASASASAKTWLLPIVTATYGYAFVQHNWIVAALGMAAVAVFALLDANYLKQERSFRALYDEVARGGVVSAFSMNPTVAGPSKSANQNYWPDLQDWRSWSIAPFYLPILAVGSGIVAYINCS